MSFFDAIRRFFNPTPKEKAEKLRKKIVNMYVHADDRRYCIMQIADLGPELAAEPLIERFTCRSENGTVDSEEKELVSKLLIDMGEATVVPLKKFLKNNDKFFNWPYRTLTQLISHDELVDFLKELLDSIGPEYVRDPERKEQLMLTLKSFREEKLCLSILPYLGDENETIRFVAADTVIEQAHEKGISALVDRLAAEDSQRVLSLIATAFKEKNWHIPDDRREDVEKNLPSEFRINSKGIVL